MSLALALVAVLAVAPVEVSTDVVDARATEAGLRARVGPALDGWRVRVSPGGAPATVTVVLDAPDGATREVSVALQGATVEERSRELAASLALVMDKPDERPGEPPPETPPDEHHPPGLPLPPDEQHLPGLPQPPDESSRGSRPALRGWVAAGPRIELGTGLRFEAGPDFMGGLWLVRDHVQPIVSFGVSGGRSAGIAMAHLRFGAGGAFGAPLLDGRLWLGGHVLAHAMWLRAEQAGVDTAWLSSTEVGGLLQYRGRRFYFGLRTGLDLTLPPASVRGARGPVRRSIPRWLFGVTFGVIFG